MAYLTSSELSLYRCRTASPSHLGKNHAGRHGLELMVGGKGLIDGEVPGHVPDFGVSLMEGGLIGFGTDSYAIGQSKTLKS